MLVFQGDSRKETGKVRTTYKTSVVMEVKAFIPQNPLLKDYIECFYTLTRQPEEKDDCYIAFPNVFSILSLNKQSKIEVAGKFKTVRHRPDNKVGISLVCPAPDFARIRYQGAADEISMYFKPLGLNAFLSKELRYYVKEASGELNPFEDFLSKMTEIFSLESTIARIEALEHYWLSKHVGFSHAFLPRIVTEMMKGDSAFSLTEAARDIGISRTTLVKHFDLHLCTAPSHFKKIARFRNAMTQQRHKFSKANLTAISADADYFDQSHMIKDFKTLTGFAPKPFFSNISSLENGRINWMFL